MAAIKDALQFRGNPDPVRGDEPFQRVRTAAKEALDAIYSDTPADQNSGGGGGGGAPFATSVSTNYGASPNQQYGNNQHQGASGGSSYPGSTGRRMEGIGNPMFKDHRLEPQQQQGIGNLSVNDMVREARETVVGMIKDPLARGMDAQVNNHRGTVPRPGGSYGGSGGGVSYCRGLIWRGRHSKIRISRIYIVILRLIFSVLFCFDCLVLGASTRSIGFDAADKRTVEHGIQPRTGSCWYSSEL